MENRVALVVGIDQYQDSPLECCANDAQEIANALVASEFGFSTTLLFDAQASRRNILRDFEACRARKPALFAFYFSGHGCVTPTGAYLVTVDGEPADEGLELSHLARILQGFSDQGCTTLVMLDCCHSGSASPWPGARSFLSTDIERALPAVGKSRVIMAACRSDQLAYEDSATGHGLFTKHLLDGLHGSAADHEGKISVNGLYEYVSRPFEEKTRQVPVFRADVEGRLLLGSGFTPRVGKPLEANLGERLEREAGGFLDEYQRRGSGSLTEWKQNGYQEACQTLEPILRWFRSRTQEYPDLLKRKDFNELYQTAQARLAQLGSVDPGTRVKRGVLSTRLGEGAFGSVWKVLPPDRADRFLAYKIYHPHDLHLADKISRFKRGYQAMERLDHPNVVKVESYTECPVGFFMAFIDGPNLRNISAGIDEPEARIRLLLTSADTVRHAHSRGVIHRDIKPENIIVSYEEADGRWIPHLTDFDLAWFSTATQLTRDAMGTTFYAAPEQLAKPKLAHEPTVDVYSFGQLSFFAVTGSDPSPFVVERNERALSERLATWSSGRAAQLFIELYRDCSRPEPKLRIQNFETIVERLGAILQAFREIGEQALPRERFIDEVIFSMAGLGETTLRTPRSHFYSLSGRTISTLRVTRIEEKALLPFAQLEVHLQPDGPISFSGMSNEDARQILNRRIDGALGGVDGVRRRSGKHGKFEVFVDLYDVPLNASGVERCRQILARTIDAMERL